MAAPTWSDKFELLDGLNSIPNVQGCFDYIIKKYEILVNNPPIQMYVSRIENRNYLEAIKTRQLKIKMAKTYLIERLLK